METLELFRGRLIDHLHLVVKNLPLCRKFYGEILHELGVPIGGEAADYFWADELFVSAEDSKATALGKTTGRSHFAFQAKNREQVDAFYKAGLAAGGRDNGAPGERKYHPGYYAAFLLDPEGNNVEAVYHGPGTYSAPSIRITYDA